MDDEHARSASDRDRVLAALDELIQALDRRVVHIERLGEARIAGEAAALRREAMTRIEQLSGASARPGRDVDAGGDPIADDGEPSRQD